MASRAWSAVPFSAVLGRFRWTGPAGRRASGALRTGLRVLAQGHLLGIYPEGTRTPDGRLYRGKTGVARLALEARVPVIPTAMVGTFEFQPPGKIAPRPWVRPGVRFGKPLDFSRYYGLHEDRIVLRAITDEIMYELMKLAGQEYVDEYAQRSKLRLAPSRRKPGSAKPAGSKDLDGAVQAGASSGPGTTASGATSRMVAGTPEGDRLAASDETPAWTRMVTWTPGSRPPAGGAGYLAQPWPADRVAPACIACVVSGVRREPAIEPPCRGEFYLG